MSGTSGPELPGYVHVYSGKVRDLYAPLDPASGQPRDDLLLFVASDRISAYDVILDTPIPDKGAILTQLTLWWYDQLEGVINHVVSTDVPAAVEGRGVLVRRLEMVPIECVGRAYLTGGRAAGVPAHGCRVGGGPARRSGRRVEAARADLHPNDEGAARRARPAAVARAGAQPDRPAGRRPGRRAHSSNPGAWQRGCRRVAASSSPTPSSSSVSTARTSTTLVARRSCSPTRCSRRTRRGSGRPSTWEPGRPQPSYDKQFVRDWLVSPESGWDRSSGEPPRRCPRRSSSRHGTGTCRPSRS